MHIRRVAFEGLRALPDFEGQGLGRVVPVLGTAAGRTALADAITIALSAFSSSDLVRAAALLGLGETCEAHGEGLPEELVIQRPGIAQSLFGDERTFRVKLDLELDPPQYGEIRAHALRDPRLVSALGAADTTLGIAVGWVLTRDWSVAATSVLGVRLGDVELPLVGEDRPSWLSGFLQGLSGRLHRHRAGDGDAQAYARAERSPDAVERMAARQVRQILSRSPFGLGELQVIEGEPTWLGLTHGDSVLPLRAFGPRVAHQVGLVQAVHLSGAEILVTEAPLHAKVAAGPE